MGGVGQIPLRRFLRPRGDIFFLRVGGKFFFSGIFWFVHNIIGGERKRAPETSEV